MSALRAHRPTPAPHGVSASMAHACLFFTLPKPRPAQH